MFAELFSCWKESLSLARWSNFKLLVAATLNNTYQSSRIVIKYFWPLLIASMGFFTLTLVSIAPKLRNAYPFCTINYNNIYLLITTSILYSSLCFLFQLTTRPSLERKDLHYFLLYLPKSIVLLPLALITGFSNFLPFGLGSFTFFLFASAPFFYLDAPSSVASLIASLKRSIKLGVYFFPGIALCYLIAIPIMIGITIVSILIGSLLFYCLKILAIPHYLLGIFAALGTISLVILMLSISFTAMLYTKIKHSNPSIFF
jgi:hypothetical protein